MSVRAQPDAGDVGDDKSTRDAAATTVVPVVEERPEVRTRLVDSGGAVRLRKVVHEEIVEVDQPLRIEEIAVQRVAVGRAIDGPVPVRHEGEVMIVPVVEERLVTRKQLFLVEEIRVTRKTELRRAAQQVTLRREEVVVERLDPASGQWRKVDSEE